MDELKYLSEYYSNYDEDGRLLSRHGNVEYLTTMKYIHRYLSPGARVLEVGAGTGRYSLALAAEGFKVDSVELIDHNVELLKSKITPAMDIATRQGNALDLSVYSGGEFDLTLVLGPMYHLFDISDKRRAVSEALRVTRRGGTVFFAYCIADASIINWGFKGGNILGALDSGMVDPETFACTSNPSLIFELYRKQDIDELMAGFEGIERLHYLGSDMATNFMRETIDAMDDATFDAYMRYHSSICERPDLVGATHHSLDIVRKM